VLRYALRLAVLSAVVVSGCVTAPAPIATRDAGSLQNWQVAGRMAVAGASGGGSGSFTWQQKGSASVVQLRGPLGVGSLQLTLDDQVLRIETGEQTFEAEAAAAELAVRLGASVPTHALRYWLLGLPAPGEHVAMSAGDTATLEQDRWRIDFQHFAVTDGVRLPMKWVAANGPAKVRVVIDKWQVR